MLLVEFAGVEARLTSEFILALWLSFAAILMFDPSRHKRVSF
jgi:hypothetical protein